MKTLSIGTLYVPLWFFVAYITLTLGLALFGPLEFVNFPKIKVTTYMMFVVLCCVIGYFFGVKSSTALTTPPLAYFKAVHCDVPRAFNLILIVATLALLGYFLSATMSGTLNTSVMSLGETYNSSYEGYQRNTGNYSISFIAYSVLSAPMFIASVWGLFYFRRLGRKRQSLVLVVTVGTVLIFTLGSGKMKQLGDLVIYVIAVAAIARGASGKGLSPRFVANLSVVAFAGLALFAFIVSQRYSVMGVDIININQKAHWLIKYDTTHPIFVFLGAGPGFAASVITGYLSQGYYGLGLTLETDPTWSHFLGSSYSMSVIGERLFELPSGYYASYPYRTGIETGWGETKWYSVFPWFASDFSFVGTGLLFGLFAFWYARAWLESIVLWDPYAVLLFTLMTVGLFYVPANNQLMHTPGGLATLGVVCVLYLLSGRLRQQLIRMVWMGSHVHPQRMA